MTEDEAKAKWCPHARIDSTGFNRPNPGPTVDVQGDWAPCVGSACMAWRWDTRYFEDRETGKAYGTNAPERFMVEPGFCGLAGKP